ncbi:MAG: hypothetical protein ACK5LN_02560 [Propioniciclava sp.]
MRVAVFVVAGAIAVVAILLGQWSEHGAVRKVAWGVAAVAILGGVLAWVLIYLIGVPGRLTG